MEQTEICRGRGRGGRCAEREAQSLGCPPRSEERPWGWLHLHTCLFWGLLWGPAGPRYNKPARHLNSEPPGLEEEAGQ